MSAFLITEILMKLGILVVIRGVILLLAKYYDSWMWFYQVFIAVWFVIVFLWNIVLIVIFSVSNQDCHDDAKILWVASVLLLMESISSI
jgi:hypothetical protein